MSLKQTSLNLCKLEHAFGCAENIADRSLKYTYLKTIDHDMFINLEEPEHEDEKPKLTLERVGSQYFNSSLVWVIKCIDQKHIQATHWKTGYRLDQSIASSICHTNSRIKRK